MPKLKAKTKLLNGKRVDIASGKEVASSVAKNQITNDNTIQRPDGTITAGKPRVQTETGSLSQEEAAKRGVTGPLTKVEPLGPQDQPQAPTAPAPQQPQPQQPPQQQQYFDNLANKVTQGSMAFASQFKPPQQTLGQKYNQAFTQATTSGQTAPATGGEARTATQQFVPPTPEAPPVNPVDQMLSQDTGYQQLLKDHQDYLSVQKQRESLTETYSRLTKEAGIPELDTQLMNMRNVIDGTEDDIRNEVTKAGGFATESQVQALTNSRNKQLISNYNNLLEYRSQQQEYVKTMTGLASQDREAADQAYRSQLDFDRQVMDYRNRFVDNAKNTYNNIVNKVGYKGLLEATGGDPYYVGMIESTLGMTKGSLQNLANLPPSEEEQLDLQMKRLQIAKLKGEMSGGSGGGGFGGGTQFTQQNMPIAAAGGNIMKQVSDVLRISGFKPNQQATDAINVLSSLQQLADKNPQGKFKGLAPGIRIPSIWAGKSARDNRSAVNAINLKVQQWASGASLTSEQTKQVRKITPDKNDTDAQVRDKINQLSHFMLGQIQGQLAGQGIYYEPPQVDYWSVSDQEFSNMDSIL